MSRLLILQLAAVLFSTTSTFSGEHARWIWTTERPHAERATRYFRTEFDLAEDATKAILAISCDNAYVAYINGEQAGAGDDWHEPGVHQIGKSLKKGRNCIAIAATNQNGQAGLLAEAVITLKSGATQAVFTDKSWLFHSAIADGWNRAGHPVNNWVAVVELGNFSMGPWNLEDWPMIVTGKTDAGAKFIVPEGFVVEDYATDEQAGSSVAITFNSKGQLLSAAGSGKVQEIRVLLDADNNGICEGFSVYQPKAYCNGMVAVGSDLYAVANNQLLFLPDKNGDNVADSATPVFPKGIGGMGEHGPHGIIHGADGMLYFIIGNSARFEPNYISTPQSPIRFERLYWGNTLPPQSSRGFMDGIGPPGGLIARTDFSGKHCEVIACGFRNAYDIAFNPDGELFSFDSDMEWDIGLPWYRPVRICHVTPGAEFGWRFGGGKWKAYYADSIPGMIDTGRGSPTGVEIYDHHAFPAEYRGAQFHCDWALGKILCVMPKRAGATYSGQTFDFMAVAAKRGARLPVTDCTVGPDGALYVSYGGRDTKGGIYRVRYIGDKPLKALFAAEALAGLSEPLAAALNQGQPLSASGRAAIAAQQAKAGPAWKAQCAGVVRDNRRPTALRVRALDYLSMDGDPVEPALIKELLKDATPELRAKAAWHAGISGNAEALAALIDTLKDTDAWVARRACEAFQRHPNDNAVDNLVALLNHDDRFVRYHARIALLRLPPEKWTDKAIGAAAPRGQAEGLLTWVQSFQSMQLDAQKIAPHLDRVLSSATQLLAAEMPADHMLVAQRALQLILLAAKEPAAISDKHKDALVDRCLVLLMNPDARVSMEAAEILGFLRDVRAVPALLARATDTALSRDQRVHHLAAVVNIPSGWTKEQYLQVLEFVTNPGKGENGHAFEGNMQQSFARAVKHMPAEVKAAIYAGLPDDKLAFALAAQGAATPADFKLLCARLSATRDDKLRQQILTMIGAVKTREAFLAMEAMLNETTPYYDTLLTHLMRTNEPDAAKYAVKGLFSLNRGVASESLFRAIDLFEQLEKTPELFQGLITCASRATPEMREKALQTLQRWSFIDIPHLPQQPNKQVEFWQEAFQQKFPQIKAKFPELSGDGYQNEEAYNKLLDLMRKQPPGNAGDAKAGKELFKTQRCVSCHSYKGEGQMLGPDLSEVSKRFDHAKILEEVVYPSRVVDARYRQINFKLKDGRMLTGFVAEETAETKTIADSNGIKTLIKNAEIDSLKVGDQSIMPQGLIDALKPEQVRDLLKFLESDGK